MGILTSQWFSAVAKDGRVEVCLRDMNGERRTLTLNCNERDWMGGLIQFNHGRGALIQDAFPFLTDSEREFLLTGMTDEEWDEMWDPGPDAA